MDIIHTNIISETAGNDLDGKVHISNQHPLRDYTDYVTKYCRANIFFPNDIECSDNSQLKRVPERPWVLIECVFFSAK